jgi:hypothetical protein
MTCLSYKQHAFRNIIMASIMFVMGAMCFSALASAQTLAQSAGTTKTPATKTAPAPSAAPVNKAKPSPDTYYPKVRKQTEGDFRYIASNGIPNFRVYNIKPQSYVFRMPLKPVQNKNATLLDPKYYFGVALDGIPIDADHSNLAPDVNGGFFAAEGRYAYKDVPRRLLDKDLAHVGYAADGFAIFVSKKDLFKPSYNNKKEFVAGSGNLDRCNGAIVNEKYYIYVITDDYPKIPLCWSGKPDPSFAKTFVGDAKSSNAKMPKATRSDKVDPFPSVGETKKSFIEKNKRKRSHQIYYEKMKRKKEPAQ